MSELLNLCQYKDKSVGKGKKFALNFKTRGYRFIS